jgi:acetyl esterase/lipase
MAVRMVLVLCGLCMLLQAQAPTMANVHYGTNRRNQLDFWRADGKGKPTPVVVLFHGGHFGGGDKASFQGSPLLGPLLAAGSSVVAVNYRPLKMAPVQEIFRDAARAIQFVRAKAKEWNVDKDRVAAFGITSGGSMALWLAFHDDLADGRSTDPVLRESTRLRAAAAHAPQFSYDALQWSDVIGVPHEKFFPRAWEHYGLASEDEMRSEMGREARAFVDVRAFISKDDPAVYLFSPQSGGAPDDRVRYLNHPVHARSLKSRCDAMGVRAVLYSPGDGGNAPEGGNDEAVMDFLLRELELRK